MATIQMTDARVKIEPEIVTQEYQFGPSDSVAANAVLLTSDNLRKLGAFPPRESQQWDCHLWFYWVVGGVETANDLSGLSIAGVYWDPISREGETLPVSHGAGIGQITIALDGPTPGLHRFSITATSGDDTFDLCTGWLEVEIGHGVVV